MTRCGGERWKDRWWDRDVVTYATARPPPWSDFAAPPGGGDRITGRGVQSVCDGRTRATLVRRRRPAPCTSALFAGVRARRGGHPAVFAQPIYALAAVPVVACSLWALTRSVPLAAVPRRRRPGDRRAALRGARAGHVQRLSARFRSRAGGLGRRDGRSRSVCSPQPRRCSWPGPGSERGRRRHLDRRHALHLGRRPRPRPPGATRRPSSRAPGAAGRQALLDERRRIARDVHDFVGHGLAAVMLQVTSARHVLRRDADGRRGCAASGGRGRPPQHAGATPHGDAAP